jgi:hypothetical protein
MGKFPAGHRYFVAFAKTHRSIMSLPGTITIMWHICQNTPPSLKRKVLPFIFKTNHHSQKCKIFRF